MNPIPLYDLLTDKEGSPLPPEPRAHAARVGWKERMGPGRPAVVLDKETQEPLVVSLHDSHGNFVRAVDNRPGHYVLVILDEHHSALGKEMIGHITISAPRNAAATEAITSGDPVLLRMLALVERAMDRAMDLAACTVEHHAGIVTANADMIRANAEATRTTHGLAARNATAPAAMPEQSGDDDEEDAREPTAIESVAYQCLAAVDVWWDERNARKKAEAEEIVKKAGTPKPAPASPPPASPPRASPPPASPPPASPPPASPPPAAPAPTSAASPSPEPAVPSPSSEPESPSPEPEHAPAKVILTPEQGARMRLVMAKLNKREQLAAQGMVMRLSEIERARWLEEFSALTVDEAVDRIREFMPEKLKGGAK